MYNIINIQYINDEGIVCGAIVDAPTGLMRIVSVDYQNKRTTFRYTPDVIIEMYVDDKEEETK